MRQLVLISLFCNTVYVNAQYLTKKQLKFINKNTHSIQVNQNYVNGDWTSVSKAIKGKSIVLLGELNHGSKEIFLVRNNLIEYLHEKEGFNTILFESGIGEMVILNDRKQKYSPEFMTLGFYGIWRTKAFAELMSYIKQENISIAGYDIQKGGGDAFFVLMEMEAKRIGIQPQLYNLLEERFDDLEDDLKKAKAETYDSLKPKIDLLIADYKAFSEALIFQETNLNRNVQLINQTIKNRISYLKYRLEFVKDQDYRKRWKARDTGMVDNIIWLKENIFKKEKILVVGHNFHISKYNKKEEVAGEYLKRKYPTDTYHIGFFVGAGFYADNSGRKKEMDPISHDSLDVRHIISAMEGKVSFLSMPHKSKKKNKWLFHDIEVNNSFIDLNGSNRQSLIKTFDGVVLIDKTSMPLKIEFKN